MEAPQFGGMEYSALITFSRDWFADYQPPAAGADFGADMLVRFIVHELGHQWWYGAVGNDQAYEPWVDEALARYGETLYYERLHPSHLGWWEAPSKGLATVPINQPIYNFDRYDELRSGGVCQRDAFLAGCAEGHRRAGISCAVAGLSATLPGSDRHRSRTGRFSARAGRDAA